MAEPLAAVFRQPFPAQLAAFRQRLGNLVPTSRWDDLIGTQHDRAFMVAGAVKADLLADLAQAVDKAIAEGTTLEEFRRDFRSIVDRHGWHGWTGEGSAKGEAWRTKVIYRTNIATSRAAGRYSQHFSGAFKYLVYRHSGAEHFRPEHLSWDGLILPVDHPFWLTHYPINDWGCGCFVRGARTLKGAVRVGGKPDVKLPPDWAVRDPATGAPKGIGKGWDHAPGASVDDTVRALAAKPINWDYRLVRAFMGDLPDDTRDAMAKAYRAQPGLAESIARWIKRVDEARTAKGTLRIVPQRSFGVTTRAQERDIGKRTETSIDRFEFTVDQDAVRHVLKRHGDPAIERSRGQRVIQPEDFGLLSRLIEEPDDLMFLGDDPQQGPVLRYQKRIGQEVYVALMAIKRRRQRIKLVTMFVDASGRSLP